MAGNASSARRQAEKDWKEGGKPTSGPLKQKLEEAKATEARANSSSGGAASRAIGW